MLLSAASKRLCRIQKKASILLRRVFKIQKNLCMIFDQIAWRLRHSGKGPRADILRSSGAKHCSSLCSQSEGDEYYDGQARAENPTKSCPKALVMFATCSWPSLCEQSELQCWRRNRRLCEPVQISLRFNESFGQSQYKRWTSDATHEALGCLSTLFFNVFFCQKLLPSFSFGTAI